MRPRTEPAPRHEQSEVGLRTSPEFLREIEELPARLLPSLPLAVTLWVELPGAPVPVCFTTAAHGGESEPVLGPRIVFDREEIAALVLGVEADRMWRRDLLGACFEKWRRPALRLGPADALAGAMPDYEAPAWSVGRVLRRLGAELVRVELAGPAGEAQSYPVAA